MIKVFKRTMLAASISALLIPMTVNSAGFGKLSVESSLNKPFSAQMPLKLNANEDIKDFRVKQAANEVYKKMGVPYSVLGGGLDFNIIETDGGYAVKITSKKDVKDPIVSLLISLEKTGSYTTVKEYSILLDPSDYDMEQSIKKKASKKKSKKSSEATVYKYSGSPKAPLKLKNTFKRKLSEGQYGPVEIGDTLYKVARKHVNNVDGLEVKNINQVMLATIKDNPKAFVKGDPNLIKSGSVVNLPTKENALSYSMKDANSYIKKAEDAWKKRNDSSEKVDFTQIEVAKMPVFDENAVDTIEVKTKVEKQAGLVLEEVENKMPELPDQSSQKVVPATIPDFNEEIDKIVSEVELSDIAKTVIESESRKEIDEAVDEIINDLNAQLVEFQKTNEELVNENEKLVVKVVGLEKQVAELLDSVRTQEDVHKKQIEDVKTVSKKETSDVTDKNEVAVKEITVEPVKQTEVAKIKTSPIEEFKTEAKIKTKRINNAASDDSGLPIVPIIAALVVIAVGFVGFKFKDQIKEKLSRGASKEEDADNIMISDDHDVEADDFESDDTEDEFDTGSDYEEDIFGDDSDDESEEEEDEDDTLSMASAYIGYNRLEEATEILKSAISTNPSRFELHEKLLEVYFQEENIDEFIDLFESCGDDIKSADSEMWDRIYSRGELLAPESPLFGGEAESSISSFDESSSDSDVNPFGDISTDDDEEEEEPAPMDLTPSWASNSEEESVSDDVISSDEPLVMPSNDEVDDSDNNEGMTSTLSMEDYESDDSTDDEDDEDSFGNDTGFSAFTSDDSDGEEASDNDEDSEDDGWWKDAPLADGQQENSDDALVMPSNEDIDEESEETEEDVAEESDESSDIDEDVDIDSQLELAQAYIDMFNHDDAKTILEMVIKIGDSSQVEQAKSMLEEID